MQLELEKLILERETNRSGQEGGKKSGRGAHVAFRRERSPDLPHFIDGKDDLDS